MVDTRSQIKREIQNDQPAVDRFVDDEDSIESTVMFSVANHY